MIIPLSTDILLTVIVHDNLLRFVSFLTLYKIINCTSMLHNNFQDNTKLIIIITNTVAHADPPSLSILYTEKVALKS